MKLEDDRTELELRVARAICAARCFRGEVLGKPCIDPKTRSNAPCRINETQIVLSWIGSAAKNVVDLFARNASAAPLPSPPTGPDQRPGIGKQGES